MLNIAWLITCKKIVAKYFKKKIDLKLRVTMFFICVCGEEGAGEKVSEVDVFHSFRNVSYVVLNFRTGK